MVAKKNYLLGFAFLLIIGFVFPVGLFAIGPNSPAMVDSVDLPTTRPLRTVGPIGTPRSLRTSIPKDGLDQTKLRSCKARQEAIKTRSNNLIKMASNMMEKFDAITQRVMDYYEDKLLPNGKTIANYGAMVTDIQDKKEAVNYNLNLAQADISDFSCTAGNPRELIAKYNSDMKGVKTALNNYRTSIKNLIVTVRSVSGQIKSASPRPTLKAKPNINL